MRGKFSGLNSFLLPRGFWDCSHIIRLCWTILPLLKLYIFKWPVSKPVMPSITVTQEHLRNASFPHHNPTRWKHGGLPAFPKSCLGLSVFQIALLNVHLSPWESCVSNPIVQSLDHRSCGSSASFTHVHWQTTGSFSRVQLQWPLFYWLVFSSYWLSSRVTSLIADSTS